MQFIKFEGDELARIKHLVDIHFSLPILYDLSGGNFEFFFAEAIGGTRETRKLLFDVTKGDIGWSLKTLQNRSDSKFEVVLKRCHVINKKFLWQTIDAKIIGDAVIDNLMKFYKKSTSDQKVKTGRVGIMLVNKKLLRFRVFQIKMAIYPKNDIVWEFSKYDKNGVEKPEIKSIIGKVNGVVVYRWYRSGTQLFGVYDIPKEAIETQFLAQPREITMASLKSIFDHAPLKSDQLIQRQVEQLSFQPDDTENDTNP